MCIRDRKILRQQFQDAGKKAGATLIPTRHTVQEVHDRIWESVNPVVEHMLQPIDGN